MMGEGGGEGACRQPSLIPPHPTLSHKGRGGTKTCFQQSSKSTKVQRVIKVQGPKQTPPPENRNQSCRDEKRGHGRAGTQICRSLDCRTRNRRVTHASSSVRAMALPGLGDPSPLPLDNLLTNPRTIPRRSRACRKGPKRSASSGRRDASRCRCCIHTKRSRPRRSRHPRMRIESWFPRGRYIPTPPPSAGGRPSRSSRRVSCRTQRHRSR